MTSTFADLGVPTRLVDALARREITVPSPIQAATLPDSLAGRDVLGRGRTGSGKTFAFLLPLVAHLMTDPKPARSKRPRALILAPTRELVTQIEESLEALTQGTRITSRVVFGGVGQGPQVEALRRGVDVVIACPGRLEDLMGQGHVNLGDVEVTILDEADHMADLGFLPGVKRILDTTPRTGQRMLFSATLDAGVDVLAKRYLTKPVTHEADSEQSPVETMEHHVLVVRGDDHMAVLSDLTAAPGRTIVFARTKHRAKRFAKQLNALGVPAVELHGNLSQGARTRTMEAFHSGAATTLVATDIAARGIHVDDVSLVIHADPPAEHKAYLHRSGRTARAGSAGTVVTLMTPDQGSDVRTLMNRAGITATRTEVRPGHPRLTELAPGERTYADPATLTTLASAPDAPARPGGAGAGRRRRSGGGGTGGGSGAARTGSGRSGASGSGRNGGSSAARTGRGGQARSAAPRGDAQGAGRGRTGRPGAAGPKRTAADFSAGRRS